MGHQHDKEPVHDLGKGTEHRGDEGHPGGKDLQAGGGRREHTPSGGHESNISGTHHDAHPHTSGGGSSGGGGGSHGGGQGSGHST